jgi:hypothetical protein
LWFRQFNIGNSAGNTLGAVETKLDQLTRLAVVAKEITAKEKPLTAKAIVTRDQYSGLLKRTESQGIKGAASATCLTSKMQKELHTSSLYLGPTFSS